MTKKRIILAKLGLDGHTNGIKIVASWLMEAGFEVIYMGLYNTPEKVVKAAIEEDADIIGLSFLEGSHIYYAERVIEVMKSYGIEGKKLVFGGVIPPDDVERLKEIGVTEVFLPGTPREIIISKLESMIGERDEN
ncbi:MAG: cobalamin B12-binding domain-containing protein [Desulfobacterota bacterium]|nr:cobalamin B12-binding domain-containing protein [Thermodesulfobacteriota bacterium]MDW8002588.1 cobalamin B12-binding domain-containing protein [Deltaproteobacteria bacterium]